MDFGRYEMQIPTHDNSGVAFPDALKQEFEAVLLGKFGGFSVLPYELRGVWRGDDGTVYDEPMRMYYLYTDVYSKVESVATYAAVAFDQIGISVTGPNGMAQIVRKPQADDLIW